MKRRVVYLEVREVESASAGYAADPFGVVLEEMERRRAPYLGLPPEQQRQILVDAIESLERALWLDLSWDEKEEKCRLKNYLAELSIRVGGKYAELLER